ncbi:MAG: hypothetical protein HY841_03995 [Bacteroidetes bacterium]|nr:hypothetical protein [Bacteroidota bacterium]
MGLFKKILVGASIGGGLIAGASYALRLRRTGKELETVTTVMVHKLDLKNVTLRVDSTLKNPTGTGLKIKYPFVKLIYQDAVIGTSQVVNRDIDVPPYGEARIGKIMIQVPLLGIFSIGAALAQSLVSGDAVKMEVNTISSVDPNWKVNKQGIWKRIIPWIKKWFPYSKKETVTLKKQAHAG